MSHSTLCTACLNIFQGHYIPLEGLSKQALDFWSSQSKTECKFRIDDTADKDRPAPHLHRSLHDLPKSANSCVLCAMMWERHRLDKQAVFASDSLEEMEVTKKDVFGIPVILPHNTAPLGMFTLAMFWAFWDGSGWYPYDFQIYPGFHAISISQGDNRERWKPVFDRQQSLLRIKSWLDSSPTTSDLNLRLPTRLLYCQPSPEGNPTVRLINTKSLDTSTRYCALSHRWGAIQPLMLRQSLLAKFTENIPFSSIPATFQDAINIANKLGIEYVWIDSLCIIQDSQDDWHAEASHMASVYSQAYVTISATSAQDSAAGLKGQDVMLKHPCEITPSWTGFENQISPGPVRIIDKGAFCEEVLSQPLFRRGWVFQEWILSPKTIHVARDQLWWTTASSMKSQGFASNETCDGYAFDVFQEHVNAVAPGVLHSAKDNDEGTIRLAWYNILQEYITRSLTFESDRLVAIAGIADVYQRYAKMPPNSYLAGLWRPALLASLLWFVSEGRKVLPPQNYRAPSWSWASVEPDPDSSGRFLIGNRGLARDWKESKVPWIPVATVMDAAVTAVGSEFGSVSDGFVVLRGPLFKALISMSMQDFTGRFTPEHAAEFLPGGKLRFVLKRVTLLTHPEITTADSPDLLDNVFPTALAEDEITIYLAILYCRMRTDRNPAGEALILTRGIQKGEYRRIGYLEMSEDIMRPWAKDRDFSVFGTLTDEQEYLGAGDDSCLYNYRIV